MSIAATPPFLNQIFYKNKTFDENFEILQTRHAFTHAFKLHAMSKIPCMTPNAHKPPTPIVIKPTLIEPENITINPYTKMSKPPMTPTPPECPTGLSAIVRPPANKPLPSIPTPHPRQNNLYDPSHSVADTLFWCIYIGMYGIGEFQRIQTNYALAEIHEKQKIANYLNAAENRKKMKETRYKISKCGVQEVQSDCHTQASTTSFPVVIAMSIFYEKNIWIVDEGRCVFLKFDGKSAADPESDSSPQIPCMIIYKTSVRNRTKYTVETGPTKGLAETIQSGMICLDHYESAIKAPSNYKMEDLEQMAEILGIDLTTTTEKKWKKSDLYDSVKQKCIWQPAGP